ncbi:survival protein SurA precursor [Candidatus Blochmanniella floridana]|uniref:Survival protein SurA n=1 Tax=Blochmanniella floridana TaxID=203907 RepID=Q7VQK1_BLOFL|nr:survival protein SurA precursor [Candidatus Blochmannia floridanus]
MKFFRILFVILTLKINTIYSTLNTIDRIAALVNQNIILKSDVFNKINILKKDILHSDQFSLENTKLYQKILDQLIINNLIAQIATKNNVQIDHNNIDQVINYVAHCRNMTKNQFLMYLQHNLGLNFKQYYSEIYQDILNKLICNHIISQRIKISTHEINQTAQKLSFINFHKQFKFIHTIIELPIPAETTQINILNNFAEQLSKKKELHDNIQNIISSYYNNNIFPRITTHIQPWTAWKNLPVIFDQYLQTAKPGDIIGPIHSFDSIHILKIQDIRTKPTVFPIIKVKINGFYSKHKEKNIHIKKQLLKIKEALENHNTTFNTIAQEQSKDFYFKNDENSPEWIDLDCIDINLQHTLLTLKKNQISMPEYTSNGWCIIKLIDINKFNYSETIRERAYLHLLNQKFNTTLDEWIHELKSESYIKLID